MQPPIDAWGPPRTAVVVWAALGAVLVAGIGLVLGLVGGALGDASAGTAVTGRGLFALAGVLLAIRIVYERGAARGVPNLPTLTAGVALAGYALDPLTWNGRAALTQLVVDPGIETVVMDAVLWLCAAALGMLWASHGLGLGREGAR